MLRKILLSSFAVLSMSATAEGCTGIMRKADNGDWVYARTMESRGAIIEKHNGKVFYDVTQWTSAVDLNQRCYYFHTQGNRAIRMVDLNKLDLNAKELKSFAVGDNPNVIQNLSNHF
jgi:penicillin V acylase-like amidase (Ntn superfamily)